MSANTESRARQIKVGDTFRSTYADSNSLWRVTRNMGRGVWEAVIENEPIDLGNGRTIEGEYNGVVDVFKAEAIRRAMAWSDMVTNLFNDQEAWWASQEVGTVLHYCDGFNKFVRGVVVIMTEENTEARTMGRERLGQPGLLPTALVGDWRKHDLGFRRPDGRVDYGHSARMVLSGEGAWQPSITCVYEHPAATSYNGADKPDPRTMEPADLTAPEATDPDSEALVRHYNEVRAILSETPRDAMDAVAKLSQVRALLDHGPEFATWEAESAYRNGK